MIAKHNFYGDHQEYAEDSGTEDPDSSKKFKDKLANINATMRQIDLCTLIFSPLVAGIIMSLFNNAAVNSLSGTILSAILFAVWNLISYFFEYSLLSSVYSDVPRLNKKLIKSPIASDKTSFASFFEGWSIYMKQGVLVLPGLAIALLYLNVLSFDTITLGYTKSQHLTEITISIFQGISSMFGIMGTVAFQLLHNKFKIYLPYIGLIGSGYQLLLLFGCFVSIWLPGSPFILATWSKDSNAEFFTTNQTYFNTSYEKYFISSPEAEYTSILVLLTAMSCSRFGRLDKNFFIIITFFF